MIVSRAAYYKAVSEVLAEENQALKEKNWRLKQTIDTMQIDLDDLHAQCMELEAEKQELAKAYKACSHTVLQEAHERMTTAIKLQLANAQHTEATTAYRACLELIEQISLTMEVEYLRNRLNALEGWTQKNSDSSSCE